MTKMAGFLIDFNFFIEIKDLISAIGTFSLKKEEYTNIFTKYSYENLARIINRYNEISPDMTIADTIEKKLIFSKYFKKALLNIGIYYYKNTFKC